MAPRFEPLIEQHHDEIFAYLWRLLGKDRRRGGAMDVEDLVQEVFLRAYESFAGLRPNSNHRAWLYKIATNCAYTKLRQMKSRRRRNNDKARPERSTCHREALAFGVERAGGHGPSALACACWKMVCGRGAADPVG